MIIVNITIDLGFLLEICEPQDTSFFYLVDKVKYMYKNKVFI